MPNKRFLYSYFTNSAGVACRAPISKFEIKNIGKAGQAGFTKWIIVKTAINGYVCSHRQFSFRNKTAAFWNPIYWKEALWVVALSNHTSCLPIFWRPWQHPFCLFSPWASLNWTNFYSLTWESIWIESKSKLWKGAKQINMYLFVCANFFCWARVAWFWHKPINAKSKQTRNQTLAVNFFNRRAPSLMSTWKASV